MFRLLAGGFAAVLLALAAPVSAEDKKDEKGTTWVRTSGDLTLQLDLGKDTAKFLVTAGDTALTVTAKMKVEKDVATIEVTDVEVKGNVPNAPKKGDKSSFKWVVKGDTATLSDLKGDVADDAKAIIEGEYKKKK